MKRKEPKHRHNIDHDDDPVPEDIDEFRAEFSRRICTFLGTWRDCILPRCKRQRACRATSWVACMRGRPSVTPQQQARVAAKLRFVLDEKLAVIERERATQEAAADAANVHVRASAAVVTRSRKPARGRR